MVAELCVHDVSKARNRNNSSNFHNWKWCYIRWTGGGGGGDLLQLAVFLLRIPTYFNTFTLRTVLPGNPNASSIPTVGTFMQSFAVLQWAAGRSVPLWTRQLCSAAANAELRLWEVQVMVIAVAMQLRKN